MIIFFKNEFTAFFDIFGTVFLMPEVYNKLCLFFLNLKLTQSRYFKDATKIVLRDILASECHLIVGTHNLLAQ